MRILHGRLEAGQRVNEVHLAAALGVSRSPLREALTYLTAEGALTHNPRRGFFVLPLTIEEVQHIYPIRAMLDPEALTLAGIPSTGKLKELMAIAKERRRADDALRAIELDDRWYHTLWGNCGNPVLIDLIEQFMRRTCRYEFALMTHQDRVPKTVDSKTEIIAHLRDGNIKAACARLRKSLHEITRPITKWLENRER